MLYYLCVPCVYVSVDLICARPSGSSSAPCFKKVNSMKSTAYTYNEQEKIKQDKMRDDKIKVSCNQSRQDENIRLH